MEAVGLITEYNPFHNGHLYHLRIARQLTNAQVVVAVMSGNFTQRGEPTILDKWTRAKLALENGVDLVIELPVFDAVQPGQRFATGALRLLNDLKVKTVVFGAEHPEWDFARLSSFEQEFRHDNFTDYRETFATQFNAALVAKTGISLTNPNDILAYSYFKACQEHGWPLELVPIKRQGKDYHDQTLGVNLASASGVRAAVKAGQPIENVVPKETARALVGLTTIPSWQTLYPILRNHLIQAPVNELQKIYQMTEGLEYRLKEAAQHELDFQSFLHAAKTKRYTFARLLRLCLYTVLEITTSQMENAQPYHHVLAFNERGQEYLHQVKKKIQYPLITKVDAKMKDHVLSLDYRAGKLYQNFTVVEQDVKHAPVIDLSSKKH